ncbi:DUF1501 domain-containing protein [Tundrisphaera sp. TA3]|uniref:DUF1501 domain-containing protein n=1 Tax=Tundrisphaera sp. TA3 TaxID=3435775 RepID=UPI003EC11E6A
MSYACDDFHSTRRAGRRSLLKAGAAGFFGLNLPSVLRAEGVGSRPTLKPRVKSIIFLHQFGGPSHIDTFDMKPGAPDQIRGEFKPIQSSLPGVPIVEHLPRFSKVLHRFAQIRSVHHRMGNHNSATYYSLTGHAPPVDDIRLRDSQELYPMYGSIAARFRPSDDPSIPSSVAFPHILRDGSVTPGQGASFLGKTYDPFFIGEDPARANFRLPELTLPADTPLARLDDRRGLMKLIDEQGDLGWSPTARGIDAFYDRALSMLASPKVRAAFDLSREPAALRDAYGRTTYGQSCLLARRLVEAGVRFVTVYYANNIGQKESGGWDTHGENFRKLRDRLLPATDQTTPTFIEDMAARGLLDETLIVWMGEFGRSPKVTNTQQFGPDGRDHWPKCYTALMAGGGVTPGAIYGSSDRIGAFPASDPVSPDDIAATMFWALGIDPETEVIDALGRPLPIASGKPIARLFG